MYLACIWYWMSILIDKNNKRQWNKNIHAVNDINYYIPCSNINIAVKNKPCLNNRSESALVTSSGEQVTTCLTTNIYSFTFITIVSAPIRCGLFTASPPHLYTYVTPIHTWICTTLITATILNIGASAAIISGGCLAVNLPLSTYHGRYRICCFTTSWNKQETLH